MNREILFRGKLKEKWVYGYYNYCGINDVHEIISKEYDYIGVSVDKETIGQFTGLTDKNGVKIFEGDRLRDDWSNGEIIIEDYVTVVWDLENGQWAVDNSFKKDGSSFTNLVDYVGFDNLEVLK